MVLDFLTTYYRVGTIKTTEAYKKEIVFVVEYDQNYYQWARQTFNIKMIYDHTFKLHVKKIRSVSLYHFKSGKTFFRDEDFIEKIC